MIKKCKICQCAIDTHLDDYCKLEDYSGKRKNSDGFYHKKCFFERIKAKFEQKGMMEKAFKILNFAGKKIGYEEEKEEVIKL